MDESLQTIGFVRILLSAIAPSMSTLLRPEAFQRLPMPQHQVSMLHLLSLMVGILGLGKHSKNSRNFFRLSLILSSKLWSKIWD